MDRQVSAEELQKAINELYYWLYGTNPSNFTAGLYSIISKADLQNKARLAESFPAECRAFDLWQRSGNEKVFFESWGLFSIVKS